MKKYVKNYIIKTVGQSFIDDLQYVLGENFNIFNMLNAKTIIHPDSEVRFRKKHIVTNIHSKLNKKIKPMPKHQIRTGSPSSRFLYVNGIITPYALALHQAKLLEEGIKEEVELFHNETEGLLKDLIECNEGRYGILNKVTEQAMEVIKDKLSYEGDLHIVAHSQGAIIITSAILRLEKELKKENLKRIKIHTFGAGFKESKLPKEIDCEHFANSLDPITHLGLQNEDHEYTGKLYIRENKGHFFIVDYLFPFLKNEFGKKSLLKERIKKEVT